MRNRKIYHLLDLLGEADRRKFSSFLRSPYFNTSKQLLVFWEQWKRKVYPLKEDERISKAEFVAGTQLKISRFDNYCSQLYQKVRAFIAQENYMQTDPVQHIMFSAGVLDRDPGLETYHRFLPETETELKQQRDSPEKYLSIFYYKAQLSIAKISARKANQNWFSEFSKMQELLKSYYLCKNLQLKCGEENAGKIFPRDPGSADQAGDQFLAAEFAQGLDLLPQMYYLIWVMQMGEDSSANFQELLELLRHHRSELSDEVANEIYFYALNYCIQQVNQGNAPFVRHGHDLYLVLLDQGALLKNGRLSPQQFKNIISLGCRLARLEWASTFIEQYYPLLSDTHGGLALEFNAAVLLFHQGEYAIVIETFKKIIQEAKMDIFYGLDARIYLWKSYFENRKNLSIKEIDEMYHMYDAFRIYIDRNKKISPQHQQQYRNFARMFNKFTELWEAPAGAARTAGLRRFRKKLEDIADISNKVWFLQKVAESLAEVDGDSPDSSKPSPTAK